MDEKETIVIRRYEAERRLAAMKRLGAPRLFMERTANIIEGCRNKLEVFGISEADYKALVDDNWMLFEERSMRFDRMSICVHYLRWSQANPEPDPDLNPCIEKDCLCCAKFEKATEEQEANYAQGLYIDTGEPVPGWFVDMGGTESITPE